LSAQTKEELKISKEYNIIEIEHAKKYKISNYEIIPMEVKHDVYNLSFLIKHEEVGVIYYATDMCCLDYLFLNVNVYMIECNYNIELLKNNTNIIDSLKQRIINSHFSDDSLKEYFKKVQKDSINNIILIHRSHENFSTNIVDELKSIVGKPVYVAENGNEYSI